MGSFTRTWKTGKCATDKGVRPITPTKSRRFLAFPTTWWEDGDVGGVVCDEDTGEVVGEHLSSSLGWLSSDLQRKLPPEPERSYVFERDPEASTRVQAMIARGIANGHWTKNKEAMPSG